MDRFDKARQLLSTEILHNFVGRITGANLSRIVGKNPENELLVGKLMSTRDEENDPKSSKTFIDSIGLDFYIDRSEIDRAEVTLYPEGDFYYRVLPSLEEQRDAFIDEVNKSQNEIVYKSFDEIVRSFEENPEPFQQYKIPLIPVYKKVSIDPEDAKISFYVVSLFMGNSDYGFADENHKINKNLEDYMDGLQRRVLLDEEIMKTAIKEPTRIEDLLSPGAYQDYITRSSSSKVETQSLNWRVYYDIEVRRLQNRYLISVSLINDSLVLYSGSHRSRKNDKFSIETLFNSGIRIALKKAHFDPIELTSFADDYKYDRVQYAVGNNCAVEYQEEANEIQTNHLPLYNQYRLITRNDLAVQFLDLVKKPVDTLSGILQKMERELESWRAYERETAPNLTEKGKRQLHEEVKGFEAEISNFKFGIEVLKNYPIVRKSFQQMNQTFSDTSKKYTTWRLFQIVFIVSILPDVVACDQDIMPDDERAKTHLSSMALLYFPTGGGKTEAFLGALVFNLFFDRYRGKECGVTSILRYPLRLLSVQQVQRLANVLAKAELIRREDTEIQDTDCFSLGYFVGDNNTPNKMKEADYRSYHDMTQSQRDEHRVLDICPFCGQETVHIRADEDLCRLVHYCDDPHCPSGGDLPIYIVDEEIYRYLPSAIISTVDKLAIMGCNANFRNLLNGAAYRCPKHGFTTKKKCIESTCRVDASEYEEVSMYDPAPTLFIQDELHLIRESLGTYASHYEAFLKYFIKNVSSSQRDIKVIGATATISSYKEQVYHLYGRDPIRFPCASPFSDHNFYSFIDGDDLQRQIIGYAPYGRAVVNSVVYSLKFMREAVAEFYQDPQKVLSIPGIQLDTADEALEILKDFWIFLEYNNVKRDGNNVDGAIKTPVNVELAKEGIIPFETRAMTGDESFQDVRDVLAQVENNEDVYHGLNLITATSMISHGVDADRFNIMFFYGIPRNMAEYIQAYSRTGRRYSSIVVDIIRPSRETDLSYLKYFESVHKYKDLLVEPVPINKWATKAANNTLAGIFCALLLTVYDPELQYTVGSMFYFANIKKAILNGSLDKEIVTDEMLRIYGCIEEDGGELEVGNQYKNIITKFVDNVFMQISDKTWVKESIFDGFKLMGYRVMNSLRDTDDDLIIEI